MAHRLPALGPEACGKSARVGLSIQERHLGKVCTSHPDFNICSDFKRQPHAATGLQKKRAAHHAMNVRKQQPLTTHTACMQCHDSNSRCSLALTEHLWLQSCKHEDTMYDAMAVVLHCQMLILLLLPSMHALQRHVPTKHSPSPATSDHNHVFYGLGVNNQSSTAPSALQRNAWMCGSTTSSARKPILQHCTFALCTLCPTISEPHTKP